MSELTFKQRMENLKAKKQEKQTINMNIAYCPMSLFEKFVSDIHLYNDCHWAKLQDIMRKAEVYDYMMSGDKPNYTEQQQEEYVPEVNEEEVLTIGQMKQARKELKEKDNE